MDTRNEKNTTRKRMWLTIIGLAVLSGAGIWVWKDILEDRFIPKRFGVVEHGRIYRSGQLSVSLVKNVLAEHNIKLIVDLNSREPDNPDQQAEIDAAVELKIRILRFPLGGKGTGDINKYARAITAICEAEKNNTPVLVHCAAGTQRTGGIVAAYRLLVQKKDLNFVIRELKHYGWRPKRNPALLPYLNDNMAELASLLKQADVIDQIPQPLPVLTETGRTKSPKN